MKRTRKLTLSAMVTALCVICLAGSALLPRVTLSLAALAGIFPAVTVLACGYGWAAGACAAAGMLSLVLLPEKTAGVWFVCFFGHYSIWKALIEALQTKTGIVWLGWCLKLFGFLSCMSVLYLVFQALFLNAIPFDFSQNALGPAILLAALLAAFVVYDYAFSVLIAWFRGKVLSRLS